MTSFALTLFPDVRAQSMTAASMTLDEMAWHARVTTQPSKDRLAALEIRRVRQGAHRARIAAQRRQRRSRSPGSRPITTANASASTKRSRLLRRSVCARCSTRTLARPAPPALAHHVPGLARHLHPTGGGR